MYNGNISETTWKTANDNTKRAYGYQYDHLNRITQGRSTSGHYDVSGITYDRVGNILSLNRKGHLNTAANSFGDIDMLAYTYDSGNKLLRVTDTGNTTFGFKDGSNTNDDYTYDANGNMIIDQNKGITSITYNHLNLPKTVTVNNASHTGNITYIYDATGVKLKKITTEGGSSTTEYAGNYVYKNGVLEFFNHTEGIVEHEADGYKYVYQYKDHLGNIRLSYKDADKNGTITQSEIVQEKNYYPFGMTHSGYNTTLRGRNHNYGFNGIELTESLDLNLYEMDLRKYDPTIARWTAIDPVTHHSMSTYNAFDNNPVFWADPSGADSSPHDLYQQGINPYDTFGNLPGNVFASGEAGKSSGNSGCPSGCDGVANPNNPIELDTVVINGSRNADYGGESDYSGGLSSYKGRYGFSGGYDDVFSQYKTKWGDTYIPLAHRKNSIDARGFGENFAAGWKNWKPGELGYDVMQYTSYAIGGTLTGVAGGSIIGSYASYGAIGNAASSGYATYQAYSTYAYTYVNAYGNVYFQSSMTSLGSYYLKNAPKPIRRLLFNKQIYRTLLNPKKLKDIDLSKHLFFKGPKVFNKVVRGGAGMFD